MIFFLNHCSLSHTHTYWTFCHLYLFFHLSELSLVHAQMGDLNCHIGYRPRRKFVWRFVTTKESIGWRMRSFRFFFFSWFGALVSTSTWWVSIHNTLFISHCNLVRFISFIILQIWQKGDGVSQPYFISFKQGRLCETWFLCYSKLLDLSVRPWVNIFETTHWRTS